MLVRMSHDWTHSVAAKLNVDVMINKSELAYRCSKLIMATYIIAVVMYAGTFLEFIQNQDDGLNGTSLLLKMDFPFAYWESPMYEYVFAVQFVGLLATASAIAILDALFISLVSEFVIVKHIYAYNSLIIVCINRNYSGLKFFLFHPILRNKTFKI